MIYFCSTQTSIQQKKQIMKNTGVKKTTPRSGYTIATLSLAAITLCFCIYNSFQLHKTKIACIDSAKVINAFHGIEVLNKKVEEKRKAFQGKLDTLSREFQETIAVYEKNRSKYSAEEAKIEEGKIRMKQDEYARFNSSGEASKNEEMKLIEKELAIVNARIARFARKKGYSAVFGATATGAVVYMNDYVDITEDVIEIIND